MIDYISRWDAICALHELMQEKPTNYEKPLNDAIAAIKAIPAAYTRENVQANWNTVIRHEHYPSGREYAADYCSCCGRRGSLEYKFCPYCGAEMKVERGERAKDPAFYAGAGGGGSHSDR